MIRWTNLETWPNRDVFIFWIHASAFVIRRAIDVIQSMNPKRRSRILQITLLPHFIYSKNAQAYINLNFGDIVGGRGGRQEYLANFAYLLKNPGYDPDLVSPLVKSYPLTRQKYILYFRL